MSREWHDWLAAQNLKQVDLGPHSEVIISEHRRGAGGGPYYHEGLSNEATRWCEDRDIPMPMLTADPRTGGWTLTFQTEDQAFEFKVTWK